MVNKQHPVQLSDSSDRTFQPKPLAISVRHVLLGGVLASSAVHAELPVPVAGQAWVQSGAASYQTIGNTLRIDQQSDKAILNWEKFNIGEGNTVQFVQPSSTSIALNRIHDQNPSTIYGQLIANGQVYLYNKNGFVFGEKSVVNVNSLIATTLNISDEVFNRGITQVFNEDGSPALAIEPMQLGDQLDPKTSEILIKAGAQIHTDKAGRIIIAAPRIENNGKVSAEDQGQVILAASKDKVYLQAADSKSPYAGLVVEVGTGGEVVNNGAINVRQGNATLVGYAVNQNGRVTATTSVNLNGSIRLLAREQAAKVNEKLVAEKTTRTDGSVAQVTLGDGSVTEVVAEASADKAIDDQLQPTSYAEISAHQVNINNATLKATSGRIDVTATDNLAQPGQGNSGQIRIASGAVIDVSGNKNVQASVEDNVGEVSVQSYELRNAPLQLDGVLKGKTIRVDLNKGSRIVDTSGAISRISRSIDQRLTSGGQINLTASGNVVAANGATLDISGGSIDYQSGFVKTTMLLTDYGAVVDISDADPNDSFTDVYGTVTEIHHKWGVEKVWNAPSPFANGRFEQGYTDGKAAGTLSINASSLAWAGQVLASSTSGAKQRKAADSPLGGTFEINLAELQTQQGKFQNAVIQSTAPFVELADVRLDENLPPDLVIEDGMLNRSGLGRFSLNTLGKISIARDAVVKLMPFSSFELTGGEVNLSGQIQASSGKVGLQALANTLGTKFGISSGKLQVAEQAVIDVSGRWVNDYMARLSDLLPTDVLNTDGGSVSLLSNNDLTIETGSVINADAGAQLTSNEQIVGGKGGSITLTANSRQDGSVSDLNIRGAISAYGFTKGGKLSLSADKVSVVPVDTPKASSNQGLNIAINDGIFSFVPNWSFSEIALTANKQDLLIADNSVLNFKTTQLQVSANTQDMPTGTGIGLLSEKLVLPEYLRQPVKLALTANSGNVKLGTGSQLNLENQSTVNLSANSVFIDGLINSAGGTVNVSNLKSSLGYDKTQSIWFGANNQLKLAGKTVYQDTDVFGYTQGTVLNGGAITVEAQRGFVHQQQGAVWDVSGSVGTVDIVRGEQSAPDVNRSVVVGSDAGKISIVAAEGVVVDGQLRANAGTASNHGGLLSIALNNQNRGGPDPAEPNNPFPNDPLTIELAQTNAVWSASQFGDSLPVQRMGKALISADQVMNAGIADLALKTPDSIHFIGDVNLSTASSIKLDAPRFEGESAQSVLLQTGYLQLGSSLISQVTDNPVIGTASLTGSAKWIDLLGASWWNHFANLTLSSQHDLRAIGVAFNETGKPTQYQGELNTASHLNLNASQIYPSSVTRFAFNVKNNPDAVLTVSKSDNQDATPLSAAGQVAFNAPLIQQAGVIKAPLGSISLNADKQLLLAEGSLTSVSAEGLLVPFGTVEIGRDWLYPVYGQNRNLLYPLGFGKQVALNSPDVQLQPGSTVDISGGGDLLAYEFKPVSAGDPDFLLPGSSSYNGSFAVIPGQANGFAPYDHLQTPGSDVSVGKTVFLNGTNELPAGYYSVLPAHYALLPGAYLVTPKANTQDVVTTRYTIDNLPVVSGYFANSVDGTQNARTAGFLIQNRDQLLKRNPNYDLYQANAFYLNQQKPSVQLPIDSGQLSIAAQTQLLLDGQIRLETPTLNFAGQSVQGRGARMDIAADNIRVVNALSVNPQSGTLEVLDSALNQLKVDSLLLGGQRQLNLESGQTDIAVKALNVSFESGSQLRGSDILAVANQTLQLKSGASLLAEGSLNSNESQINLDGDSAFLRVSAGEQVKLSRTNETGISGQLIIDSGASLSANRSMLLDASRATELNGDLIMQGGSLQMGGNTVNFGEVTVQNGSNALNLSNQKLASLTVDDLILNSRSNINFIGQVGLSDSNGIQPLTFKNLILDGAGISGSGNAGKTAWIKADSVTLQNSRNVVAGTGDGSGSLNIDGGQFTQGAGEFAISGFSNVNLKISDGMTAQDHSKLSLLADSVVQTGYLTALGGKRFNIDAGNHALAFTHNPTAANPVSRFGASVAITADSINFDTTAILHSGQFSLTANNGDVVLGSQAVIDLSGQAVAFGDQYEFTPGGVFSVLSKVGKIEMAQGSQLNVSTGGGQAAGGKMLFTAPTQTIALNGDLLATASSVSLDFARLTDSNQFDAMIGKLAAAGVDQSLAVRSRLDSLTLGSSSVIRAQNVVISADNGDLTVNGTINANGEALGGTVNLYAGKALRLTNGSRISATGVKGGSVQLSSMDTAKTASSGISLASGSVINVAGANDAQNGSLRLRTLRDGSAEGVNIQPLAGTITGAKQVVAEGVKVYGNANLGNDGSIDQQDIVTIKTDANDFMSAARISKVAALGANLQLQPGIEIRHTGNLTLNSPWDLSEWRYSDNPGQLVIRTDGNLNINRSLSDGFINVAKVLESTSGREYLLLDKLQSGASWSYALTSGSDLSSQDYTRTNLANTGNLTIGTNSVVRTGSGNMLLNAGGDIAFGASKASVTRSVTMTSGTTTDANDLAFLLPTNFNVTTGLAGVDTGAYITGAMNSGIADGTRIVSIRAVVAAKNSVGAMSNSTTLRVANVSGWQVGDYLLAASGASKLPTNVYITKIDSNTNTVTLSAPTTLAANTPVRNANLVLSAPKYRVTTGAFNMTANYVNGSVYNAGQAGAKAYGSLGDLAVAKQYFVEYPVNGGDLVMNAGGNINGLYTNTDFNNWLLRIGNVSGSEFTPSAWGVALGIAPGFKTTTGLTASSNYNGGSSSFTGVTPLPRFRQNIGSFGGGRVMISAKGDINNLEVAMPTTGKPVGLSADASVISKFTTNALEVNGGGVLTVNAGQNISGGTYFVGQGALQLNAGNQITGTATYEKGPVLLSGDTQVELVATDRIDLAGVFDPMVMHKNSKTDVNFSAYTANSSVSIQSLAGDVNLWADNKIIASRNLFDSLRQTISELYPSNLHVSAFAFASKADFREADVKDLKVNDNFFAGSVNLQSLLTLFPSATGQLSVFAENNIQTPSKDNEAVVFLGMSDFDPTLLPTSLKPIKATDLTDVAKFIAPANGNLAGGSNEHAAYMLHQYDTQPVRLFTRSGDIKNIGLYLPKSATLQAGQDISGIALNIQNLNAEDASLIEAGRDLIYPVSRDADTGLLPESAKTETLQNKGIKVAGPGMLLVKTGRNVDLGQDNGISTVGNSYNPALPNEGASITSLVGLNQQLPDFVGFINQYGSAYATEIVQAKTLITDFVRQLDGNPGLDQEQALTRFSSLSGNQYLSLQPQLIRTLLPVLMSEVKLGGSTAAASSLAVDKEAGYQRAYAAIEQFFPGSAWKGDLSLFFSKLQTLKNGDINILTPGGGVNAGLAVSVAGEKSPDRLGIVAQGKGAVNSVVLNDFQVNRSRVFALNGSDIQIWSSAGNIDAGKGAKSSIAAPPPVISFDAKGNLVTEFPPAVSGSGIRTAAPNGTAPGDVYLFAPKGVIDAGEAGIGGTNVTLSATAVLGANNIQVGGVGTGVPVAASGSVAAGLTGTSNVSAGVSQAAESSVGGDVSKNSANSIAKSIAGILNVELIGFGN